MKKCVLLLICCLLILSSAGCAKSPVAEYAAYDASVQMSSLSSQVVASNADYELYWNEEAYCVQLKHLLTGKVWASTPYEYEGASSNVTSPLNITVLTLEGLAKDTYRASSEAIGNGTVSCEKIENGVRVTYFFDNVKISVPVNYVLNGSALDVTVDAQNITEGDAHHLISVSVAPFMCSAKNDNEGSYLFIPSGSGALMYATETVQGSRIYTGNVFGGDLSYIALDVLNDNEALRLPVFGAKDGDRATLCVLKDGAESVVVEAEAGNSRTGYSNVYATFYMRGYDTFATTSANSSLLGSSYSLYAATGTVANPTLSYYPLTGDDADYNGMARCYRKYLETSGSLLKTEESNATYGLTVLGGAQVTDSFLGIPHDSTVAATTFVQAKEIIARLSELSSATPAVRLLGFGDRGVNPGKLAGGFSLSSLFGSNEQRLDLETYCSSSNILLFSDFDLVRFNRSANGFSTMSDVAKTSTLRKAEGYPFATPFRDTQKQYTYYLLNRNQLLPAAAKLLKSADKQQISGVSFMTLGHLAYSDYSDMKYAVKGNTQREITALIKSFLEGGHVVAGGPNAYSAAASTVVFDAPTDNGGNFSFDEEIPFYEMVFRGSKPVYGESVNLADDRDRAILRSVAYGANLSFSVMYNYDTNFTETDMVYPELGAYKLYACNFNENTQFISNTLNKYASLYKKISGANMVRYTRLSENVTETVYDNGVIVYVNHGKTAAASPIGELAGFEVKY